MLEDTVWSLANIVSRNASGASVPSMASSKTRDALGLSA